MYSIKERIIRRNIVVALHPQQPLSVQKFCNEVCIYLTNFLYVTTHRILTSPLGTLSQRIEKWYRVHYFILFDYVVNPTDISSIILKSLKT